MLFEPAALTSADAEVVALVEQQHRDLRPLVATPRRWGGLLRKVALARAVQGSNTIEGFVVSLDDAFAALDDQDPLSADELSWLAVRGYRDAMTYVLQLAKEPACPLSSDTLKALHFMMQQYDLDKWPGRWRPDLVYVHDESTGQTVYVGPDAVLVPDLMAELVESVNAAVDVPLLVRAAMAHLNLAMVHPFKDGNGRMARCLQTLVLARSGVLAAEFSSVEEYLAQHVADYYRVLARVGRGSWQPGGATEPWIRFSLTAHHRQAIQVTRRARIAGDVWACAEEAVADAGLNERCVDALAFGMSGMLVRNATYRQLHPDVSHNLASRDLNDMVKAGVLEPFGERRGRRYVPSSKLWTAAQDVRRRIDREYPVDSDPYELVAR